MTGRWRRRWPLVTADGHPARRHPESLGRELPAAAEEWLGEVCAELWPDDEYVCPDHQRTGRGCVSDFPGVARRVPAHRHPGLRDDACMPISPSAIVRVPPPLEAAARKAAPELAGLSLAELLRAGLAMLAGAASPAEAAASARLSRAPHDRAGGRRRETAAQ